MFLLKTSIVQIPWGNGNFLLYWGFLKNKVESKEKEFVARWQRYFCTTDSCFVKANLFRVKKSQIAGRMVRNANKCGASTEQQTG
jgi:hypothetical protein